MHEHVPPQPTGVECEQYHAILYVPDVASAVDWYTKKLGFTAAFTRAIRRGSQA